MIYTITFNPAIDLVIQVEDFHLGNLNRSKADHYVVGGKGINASLVFNRLGLENIATGFVGGFSGQYIIDKMNEEGIANHFIALDQITRINVKLKGEQETEINAKGPAVSEAKFKDLMTYLEGPLQEKDVVFLAGNAAPGLDAQSYIAIAKLCQKKACYFVLDSNKDLLKACLPYGPFIIKPNREELSELFEVEIQSQEDLLHYAKELQKLGAKNVLVSMGGEGSILLTQTGQVYSANVPEGKVLNSVGAGDSMLAGFISQYTRTHNFSEALQMGAACGSATAFSVGIAEKELIDHLKTAIKVKKI